MQLRLSNSKPLCRASCCVLFTTAILKLVFVKPLLQFSILIMNSVLAKFMDQFRGQAR